MQVGLIADVHGNAAALRLALAALADHTDEILVAGDALNSFRFSDEVIDMVRERRLPYVLGNHERTLIEMQRSGRGRLGGSDGNWEFVLQAPSRWELDAGGRRLLMVHGSPWPPYDDYLYADHHALARVPELGVDFLVLGHTHVPMELRIGSTLVVNPGSAGEARGGTRPSYAILDTEARSVRFAHVPQPILSTATTE